MNTGYPRFVQKGRQSPLHVENGRASATKARPSSAPRDDDAIAEALLTAVVSTSLSGATPRGHVYSTKAGRLGVTEPRTPGRPLAARRPAPSCVCSCTRGGPGLRPRADAPRNYLNRGIWRRGISTPASARVHTRTARTSCGRLHRERRSRGKDLCTGRGAARSAQQQPSHTRRRFRGSACRPPPRAPSAWWGLVEGLGGATRVPESPESPDVGAQSCLVSLFM